MSYNQSRGGSDKSDLQYRKPGRSVSSSQQRTSSVSHGKGGGPPVPSPSSSSLSSNRRYPLSFPLFCQKLRVFIYLRGG